MPYELLDQPAGRYELLPDQAEAGPRSIGSELARQAGLFARAGIKSVTALPEIAGNALNSAVNLGIAGVNSAHDAVTAPKLSELVTGRQPWIKPLPMVSDIVNNTIDKAGLPQPESGLERVVQQATSSMGAAGPSVKFGELLAKNTAPVIKAVGEGLRALPGMQMLGSAGAGAGGQVAAELGLGPFGQLGGSIVGGTLGAISPSTGLAAGRGVVGAVKDVAKAVQPAVNPQKYVGTRLAAALGQDAPEVAAKLTSIPEYVPGSMPTTAQAAPTPVLVATEKAAANGNPAFKIALAQREAENNAARWRALDSVARSPQELEDAIKARSAVARPQYEAAHAEIVPMDDGLLNIASRPAVKRAMREANLLALNEGEQVKWPTPNDPTISGKALDYTNRALGDLLGAAKASNKTETANALAATKRQLEGWMEQKVPGVREASSDYAAFSSPVNTMEAGQHIAGTLGTRALDSNGLPMIQMNAYRSALIQALKKQAFGIDEGAHKTLQGIGQDLQRSTISNSLRSPGSDTAYNIAADGWLARQLYGEDFKGASTLGRGVGSIAAVLSGHPFLGGSIMAGGKKLGETVGKNLNDELAALLLDPPKLVPYLKAKPAVKGAPIAIGNNVSRGAIGASVGAARTNQ